MGAAIVLNSSTPGTAVSVVPTFSPIIPSTASATITGGQVLKASGSGTMAPTSAKDHSAVGVAFQDAANTFPCQCIVRGSGLVVTCTTSGTVTAGDEVTSAAAGAVASLAATATAVAADINDARSVIGIALTTATTGLPVQILLA